MLKDYKPQLDTPKRQGRLALVYIQFTISDGSGTPVIDTDRSSPGTTIARNGTGQYTMTFPKSQFAHYMGGGTLLAEQLGSQVYPESLTASSGGVGTLTFEMAITPGTAADPAQNTRVFVTLLVGGY